MQRNNIRFQRRNTLPEKPVQKLDLNAENFPDLSTTDVSRGPVVVTNTDWKSAITSKVEENIRRFSNGDSFIGEYDENGHPAYGKLMFANGNTYCGPIFTSWPQDPEPYYEEMPDPNNEYSFVYYYGEDEYVDPYQNYGEMIYPDGKSFWGVFCFDQLTN